MLPALFAVTLFVGASLLFMVQPLVGKLLLPLVGGSPGVWNTCMVFFQAVLLAGYLYAHRATGRLGVRRQAVFHLVLLLAVVVWFKVALTWTGSPMPVVGSLLPEDQDYPTLALVGLLGLAVGGPFFVLCTSSPLLQRWFAATGCKGAKDPYFLYAASNAGSLFGLLGYPLLVEPRLTLAEQQWVFAGGFCVLVALVFVCAATLLKAKPESGVDEARAAAARPARRTALPAARIARWVFLSALPSSLLLGVTTHVSNTLAPVPLLWAVPLSLYLISFIVVFARWPESAHRAVGRVTPVLLLFVVLSLLMDATEPFFLIGSLHLGAFFGVCLLCHGELARNRPPAEHLTAFYFWLSVGGVIGGLCNGLVAPVVFHRLGLLEYPLALILAATVRPRAEEPGVVPLRFRDVAFVAGLLALSLGLVVVVPKLVGPRPAPEDPESLTFRLLRGSLTFGIPAAAAFALVRRPARYALALAALFLAGAFDYGQRGDTLHMERNFFGVVRVSRSPDGRFVRLIHGTTVHGQQRTDEPGRPRPLTYYYEWGPVGRLFDDLSKKAQPPRRVGVVGLGTGAVSYYAQPGQNWTFFEIDPAVVRIAQNPAYFRFLSNCRADSLDIVLGDARRQLSRFPDGGFDVLILDGFCSDSIPVHLLTREAFALYFQKLAPDGVLAVNVTNPHLDVAPLVARTTATLHPAPTIRYRKDAVTETLRLEGKTASEWMVLARDYDSLGPVAWDPYWDLYRAVPDGPVWRDDFANVLGVWRHGGD